MRDPMAATQVDGGDLPTTGAHVTIDEPEIAAELTRLDRYVLLERVGKGSSATVWAAYDPELDRRVAVKVLLGDASAVEEFEGQIAEAQALAQLAHPNVVAVHDVQRITPTEDEDQDKDAGPGLAGLFIVMEFLAGPPLNEWMGQGHGWREVLTVFADAGRGLQAAHERGLIHRDFKPGNVMFGNDGRVRVLDFGLARSGASIKRRISESRDSARVRIVGTPAYMAPEQHIDAEVDPRSDQFAFCATLYEALFGQRPFAGQDRASLAKAKLSGDLRPAPRGSSVPAWVQAAVLRGLEPKPDDRYPSMAELLAALERDPSVNRRRWFVGAALLAIFSGSAIGLASVNVESEAGATERACEVPEDKLAGVWDAEVRERVRASFQATEAPYADEAFERVDASLNHHMGAWVSLHEEVCRATLVEHEQPAAVMGEQMLCLDRHLRRVAGLTAAFSQADSAMVARSVDTVLALESPQACRAQINHERRKQLDAEQRKRLLDLEGEIARAGALADLHRYAEALEAASRALEQSEALGDPGASGRAALARTRALWGLGRLDEAVAASEVAIAAASRVDDHETLARTQLRLIRIYIDLGKYDAAEAVARICGALVKDGQLSGELEAEHDLFVAVLEGKLERWDEALVRLEHGLELRTDLYGPDHPELATFHNTMGNTLLQAGRNLGQAREHYEQAQSLWIEHYGAQYPELISLHNNLGALHYQLGEFDDAREQYRTALDIQELTAIDAPKRRAALILNLGLIALHQGRHRDAIARFESGLSFARETLDANHPLIARFLGLLGTTQVRVGEAAAAEALLREAVEIQREASGPGHSATATAHQDLANCLRELGRLDEAAHERAAAITIYRHLPEDDIERAEGALLEAWAALDAGEPERARELAEASREAVVEAYGPGHPELLEHELVVVLALRAAGERKAAADRARAAVLGPAAAEHDRRLWRLQYELGTLELALGRRGPAVEALELALGLTEGPDGNPRWAAQVAGELAPLVDEPARAEQLANLAAAAP